MFLRTYGMMYMENAELFKDFFVSLTRYYTSGSSAVNLSSMLSDFWADLLERMFRLVNVQYEFNDTYMECVSRHTDQLQPFGDVPRKLRIQITRAFVAARTFVRGLSLMPDVVSASPSCVRAAMKMLYCPYCSGQVALKPCQNYCLNVMRGSNPLHSGWCTYPLSSAGLILLDSYRSYWFRFTPCYAMLGLAERLEGPFNFESVMDPIDVKISEAIMNMQENSMQVSQKVRTGPVAKGLHLAMSVGTVQPKAGKENTPSFYFVEQKTTLKSDKHTSVPHRYQSDVIGNGLANQVSNPDVEVDITKPDVVIRSQIAVLKDMTSRLKAAHSGNDNEISFDSEEEPSGDEESGSGCDSPSCSGDDIYFSIPLNPVTPQVKLVHRDKSAGVSSQGSMALALCGLALALLVPHLR
ncbi:hypothetical protein XENOCAPTIV_018456 [Xenoophorus captivus]|uniref:Glypican-4 n=1 Tax=Xenoophorus captivus TaxID=1517983 RepID=A0ABV0RJC2_9TELE